MAHKLDKPKEHVTMSKYVISTRVRTMLDFREQYKENLDEIHVSISQGNIKTGSIPSVSLIPIADCDNCSACMDMCYDVRNDCRSDMPTVLKSRARNSAIANYDPDRFFDEIWCWIKLHPVAAFRWHIGGDILNRNYLIGMIALAKSFPNTTFFAFTKMFDVVNEVYREYKDTKVLFPTNLKIVFSAWPGQRMNNPYNFPTANPLFTDTFAKRIGYDCTTTAHVGAMWCPGDCTECFFQKKGCMNLKPGEEVIFPAH